MDDKNELNAEALTYERSENNKPSLNVSDWAVCLLASRNLLGEADCLVGADRSACAALCALVSVDAVDIALGNCAHGALVYACAASNAVTTNYVSHNDELFIVNNVFV